MEDTRPKIQFLYTIRTLEAAHDGPRFVGVAWNDYHGAYIVAPEYPNAAYTKDQARESLKRKVEALHGELSYSMGPADLQGLSHSR